MPIPGELLKQGWGVLRMKPWHLAGVFAMSSDAEGLARTLGPAYVVKYGDHVPGSGDFKFASTAEAPLA